MKLGKSFAVLGMALGLTAAGAMTALAGEWIESPKGWWYQNNDGTYPSSCWKWIDGDYDDIAQCYYFDAEGYMLASTTTPDGYQVDANGCWTENGTVQTKSTVWRIHAEERLAKGEEAKDALYEAEDGSFTKRKRAALNYLEALGYNTGGLSITKSLITYSGMGSAGGGASLGTLLSYNHQNAFNALSDYVYGSSDADSFIEAVEDYLY